MACTLCECRQEVLLSPWKQSDTWVLSNSRRLRSRVWFILGTSAISRVPWRDRVDCRRVLETNLNRLPFFFFFWFVSLLRCHVCSPTTLGTETLKLRQGSGEWGWGRLEDFSSMSANSTAFRQLGAIWLRAHPWSTVPMHLYGVKRQF